MKTTAKKTGNHGNVDLSWFEIPVSNLDRAINFYNQIYDIQMERTEANGYSMGFFPVEKDVGGALVMGPGCVPSQTGSLIYLNANGNLEGILEKIGQYGGRVILGKTEVQDDGGHFALFLDSEGNKLALHSKKETPVKTGKKSTKAKSAKSKSTGKKSRKTKTTPKSTSPGPKTKTEVHYKGDQET